MRKPPFLKKVKHVHLTGIGGIGMFSLACCLQDLKIKITGSDSKDLFMTDAFLKNRGLRWQTGFNAQNLKSHPDLLITTAAHEGLKNPEVKAAVKMGIPVMTHAQALGRMMEGKEGIAVCGVGGKSTTAAMVATMLSGIGKKPSYAIGVASIDPLGVGGKYDSGIHFVAEADEYANCSVTDHRPRFCFQEPKVIIVTNIEYDHPDIYRNLKHTKSVFKSFFSNLPNDGLLIACQDNQHVRETVKNLGFGVQTYGFSPQADWRVEKVFFGQEHTIFSLSYRKALMEQVKLKVPGRFNVLNATAVFALGTFYGIAAPSIIKGLASFGGTKRRFELIGEVGGIRLYDDYAHHPEEIKATLDAAKKWLPDRRMIVIFQPHTYSRTKALFEDFARSFSLADLVVISDIYASARETDNLGMNGRLLAEAVKKHRPRTQYLPGKKEVAEYLSKICQKGDVVFTMGAGDIFLWHKGILKSLKS